MRGIDGHADDITAHLEDPMVCAVLEQLVIRAFELPHTTLRAGQRGRAPTAFARQVAIYLAHVHLGRTITAAARQFGRDRTTASHAVRVVEDRREDPDVDRRILAVEKALDAARQAMAAIGERAG